MFQHLFKAMTIVSMLAFSAPAHAGDGKKLPDSLVLHSLKRSTKIDRKALQGKKLLVQFWASWCVGCGKVMEDMIPIAPDGNKAMYLSVSVDESKAQAISYFDHQKDLVKPMVNKSWIDPDTKLATALNIKSLPALVLIDSEGNVTENLYGHPNQEQMQKIADFLK